MPSVEVRRIIRIKRILIVIFGYQDKQTKTDKKVKFYDELVTLVRSRKSSAIAVVAGDSIVKVRKISASEAYLGGRGTLLAQLK